MESNTASIILIGYLLVTLVLSILAPVFLLKWRSLKRRFDPAITLENNIENVKKKSFARLQELKRSLDLANREFSELNTKKSEISNSIDFLQSKLDDLREDENIELSGFKPPVFELEDHAAYVVAIKHLREQQKSLIRQKDAVYCPTEWTVGGSKREGQKMTNRIIRLTLRAFNGEVDLMIKNVTWKNAIRTKERIEKVADVINDLNESNGVIISSSYVALKIKEVDLQEQEKIKREEEKQRLKDQRELEREEAKAQREYLAEIKRQERLENERMLALKSAREQLAVASAEHRAALEDEILKMEDELAEAIKNKGRLLSMSEQTRIGHVYVISNEGSFGQGVLKIGMTRRLEPMDRVKELGDASVPFPFEVHALLFSNDAPALEKRLHAKFDKFRVNRVNNRKEFFRVEPEQVRIALDAEMPNVPFEPRVYSQEYLQSLS